jgi:translation initiation factor IF-3
LRPKTEEHDLQVKLRHIRRFLEENNKVKVSMMFRGREISYTEIGRKIMGSLVKELEDIGVIDQPPRLEGRNMVMIVAPKKQQ